MIKKPGSAPAQREPLSRERVLRAAMDIADGGGLASLTIRSLARALDAKPMSLYHHVRNKDEILDGIVDAVFEEIELPVPGREWKAELKRRAASARDVLRRHPWAIALMESRTAPGPANLCHHDATLGTLRAAGFSLPLAAHAYAVLDAYVYGTALQEASLPFDGPDSLAEVGGPMVEMFTVEDYPHLREFAVEHVLQPGYDFSHEFDFGLGLIIGGLAASLQGRSGTGEETPERAEAPSP